MNDKNRIRNGGIYRYRGSKPNTTYFEIVEDLGTTITVRTYTSSYKLFNEFSEPRNVILRYLGNEITDPQILQKLRPSSKRNTSADSTVTPAIRSIVPNSNLDESNSRMDKG
jgi:hypothetical protein